MEFQDLLVALGLGAFAVLVLGGIAYALVRWLRRRRDMGRIAAALGFEVVEDDDRLLSSPVTGLLEFRAAVPGRPGQGRFDHPLRRPEGEGELWLFDYRQGSAGGETALVPFGTYACFTGLRGPVPPFRIVPRPAPGPEVALPHAPEVFRETYAVEIDPGAQETERKEAQRVRDFLTAEKLEALVRAEPGPWFVEMRPVGTREGAMALAVRSGAGKAGVRARLRRFRTVPAEELGTFVGRARALKEILLRRGTG